MRKLDLYEKEQDTKIVLKPERTSMQGPMDVQLTNQNEILLNPKVSIQALAKLKVPIRQGRNKSFLSQEDEREEKKKQAFQEHVNLKAEEKKRRELKESRLNQTRD